jgi:hypothetical protein
MESVFNMTNKNGIGKVHQILLVLVLMLFAGVGFAAPPKFATPDEADLVRAARSLQDGFEKAAVEKFMRAAKFGNKEAQKSLGLMFIKGMGVKKDWARAFAWLKLASSHGDPRIVAAREEVYGALRDDEKALADTYYLELLQEYSDQKALERRGRWVRKQKREVTGSRLGNVGNLRIQVADATGYTWELSGRDYFDVLNSYIIDFEAHIGEVEFGELEVLEDDQQANR